MNSHLSLSPHGPHGIWLPRLVLSFIISLLGLGPLARAATAPTAAIRGTVSNAATANNLNQASVRIEGRPQEYLTERDGTYAIIGLAPGTYQVTASYTGLDRQTTTVTVSPGETSRQDFNLTSGIYKMDAMVVASEVEGNAAELNKQKKSDVFMQSVSADMLGAIPQGNIGEFLKYIPGLLVDYGTVSDANSVSMRGQDAESTLFTFDGMVPAATGFASRAGNANDVSSRALAFRDTTIDNVESIEVFKAPPPWMAPSTGGVINAVTKNAFAQKGRRLTTVFTLNANSEMMSLNPIEGPGQRSTYRIKPGGRLNYSEAFLSNTLGVSFTYGESHVINPRHINIMAYTPVVAGTTANPTTDASPVRFNSFSIQDGPEVRHRRNLGLDLDYRLGAHTVLKLNARHNDYFNQGRGQQFGLSAPAGSTFDPGFSDTDVTIRNGQVTVPIDYNDSHSQAYGYTAKVEHRFDRWRFDYAASYSKSDAHVYDLPAGFVNGVTFALAPARGVAFRVQTSPDQAAPTGITQIAGPDLYNLSNYTQANFTAPSTAPRYQNDRTWNLKLNARRDLTLASFPVELRAGSEFYQLHRRKMAGNTAYTFFGPDGIANSGDELLNASRFEKTTHGDSFLYVRNPPVIDGYKVADYMREFPRAFQDTQGANVQRGLSSVQQLAQDVTAGYAAATVRFTPKLTVVGGVRGEKTENFARGPVRRDRLAAGLPANSPEFFRAAYSQSERVTSSYRDYFPNWQASYRFNPDLVFRGAITRSMSRPSIQSTLPSTTVIDDGATPNVTVNNVALNPTYSNNIDLGLELYTRPSGSVSIGWFRKTITNYIINDVTTIGTGAENGFDGQYAGYELRTQTNGGEGHFEGIEVSARQQLQQYLKFLPEVTRDWGVFFGYTKNYKGEAPNRSGVLVKPIAPAFFDWFANYGVSYQTPRRAFYIEARATLFPQAVTTLPSATDLRPVYLARKERWDLTLRYRFNHRYSLEFNGGNIFKVPSRELIRGGRLQESRFYGASYALSFTASLADMKLPFIDR